MAGRVIRRTSRFWSGLWRRWRRGPGFVVTMPFLAAKFEGLENLLIFLVFILISGISTWLQKKRAAEEDGGAMPGGDVADRPGQPLSPRRAVPPQLKNWEEELRRLLEGDRYEEPVVQPPKLERRSPAPPPLVVGEVGSSEGPRVSRLEESDQAYRRAQQLQREAAARLKVAQAKTAQHQAKLPYSVHARRRGKGTISRARELVSNPGSARQAIIASVVLGPPKGLE